MTTPRLTDDELQDLAHSAYEEAMSLGLSVDTFLRYFKGIRNRLATQAQGQDAAPAEQPQDDEPTWQELEDFRKRHWTHWNAADNLLIAHLAQKLKCAARAKE